MRSNAHLIAYLLGWSALPGADDGGPELTVSFALPLPEDGTRCRTDVAYVIPDHRVADMLDAEGLTLVSCSPDALGRPSEELRSTWVIPPSADAPEEVLEQVQESITRLRDIVEHALDISSSGGSVEEVLAVLDVLMTNPFALFDASLVLVATAGDIPHDSLDQTWNEVLTLGYSTSKQQSREENVFGSRMLRETGLPFIMQLGDEKEATVAVRGSGQIVGFLGATDLVAPLDAAALSAMHVIQLVLERCGMLQRAGGSMGGRGTLVLERLLSGHAIEASAVTYLLGRFGWTSGDCFRVLFLFFDEEKDPQAAMVKSMCVELREALGLRIAFPFEEGIVCVERFADGTPHDPSPRLGDFLSRKGMRCTISAPFSPFSYLRHAYLQCRELQAMVAGTGSGDSSPAATQDDGRVTDFMGHYQDLVLSCLDSSTSLRSLCDPQVLDLAQTEAGRVQVTTLREYLSCGESATQASKRLYVHRNTLLYRIERLEERLGISLKELTTEQSFELLFSCMIVDYLG